MSACAYNITLIGQHERISHNIDATDPAQAIRFVLGMIPACFALCRITCKPANLPAQKPQEQTPCADY